MRITYIVHTRFPTEKAHGRQMAEVCRALAALKHEVTIVAPVVPNTIRESAAAYYQLPKSIEVVPLSHGHGHRRIIPGKWRFLVTMLLYGRAVRKFLKSHPADVVYVRSPILIGAIGKLKHPTRLMLELHSIPERGVRKFVALCNRCDRVVCLTSPMRDAVVALGVHASKVIVEGDAVDLTPFTDLPDPEVAKEEWKLPCDVPVVGYVGSLVTQDTMEKGVRELIDALALLKNRGIICYGWIVGGPENWVKTYKEYAYEKGLKGLIQFEGSIPGSDVPKALRACDICVYPAPASDHPYFQRDTSPLKLFEYLASERPVVCADLPPVRDVVDEKVVRFCRMGDAASIADEIQWMIDNPDEAAVMAERGRTKVGVYTWKERMKRILKS